MLHPEEILEGWESWNPELSNQPVLLTGLGSGLTNRSYLLDSDIGKLVLRINNPNSETLGINRKREALILDSLDKLEGVKIGPETIHIDPKYRYLVYRFIDGDIWTKTDSSKPHNQQRLKQLISKYQEVRLPITPRSYKNYLLDYWQQLEALGLIDDKTEKQFSTFIPTLEKQSWVPKLSHHDLTPENIIETPEGLRIIDWEYSHLGHPDLDWASITNDKHAPSSELLYWMNRLWQLLAEAS